MSSRSQLLGVLVLLLVGLTVAAFFAFDDSDSVLVDGSGGTPGAGTADSLRGSALDKSKTEDAPREEMASRAALAADPASVIGVRGVVLDVKTRKPLVGVEVVALRMLPNLERPMTRLRSMFGEGLWTDTSKPVKLLGSAITQADGSFEMFGLPPGRVFLDARSERAFLRNPGSVRLATGQIEEGVELLASPGGRIVGQVFGPEGAPAKNTRVSVRPGLNSFLGQLTQRKYKWLEAMTDEDGRFLIAGVPTGDGYSVTIASPEMALEERHGVDIALGQTVEMVVHGKIGASVTGRAVDASGMPVASAQVAMVYLDFSRMVFSADGREEAITTDENGYFQLKHVAPGRVAMIAATESLAPSNIHELAVVDGGVYSDVVLTLDAGRSFSGLVVDGEGQPISGVAVEIRPQDFGGGGRRGGGGDGPNAMKMALKIRRVETTTDGAGRFTTQGVAGKRLSMTFTKPGYITVAKRGTKVDVEKFTVVMTRGVTVRGKVQLEDGTAVTRFRVRARSREVRPEEAAAKGSEKAGVEDQAGDRADDRADEGQGFSVQVGTGGAQVEEGRRGRRGRGDRWRRPRDPNGRTTRMREGRRRGDEGFGGSSDWDEVKSAAGRFTLAGLPSGKVKIEVRAEGFLDPEVQSVELTPGGESDELVFVVQRGASARGLVRDAATGLPVAEATVTAYVAKKKKKDEGFQLFRPNADAEDFDILGMAGREGRQSAMTDGAGEFLIRGLKGGDYRFTARHPDMAKASVKDVTVEIGTPTEGIEIELTAGGAIEGIVTGRGKLPLASAMVVAFSISAGSFKSDATDRKGFYRIDGLPKGQYIVFKSRMDERSQDLGMDLMSNMRLKTTNVRANKTTRRDIHDEAENSVRVFGVVRDEGKPVKRSVITMLGRDRDGVLGMGIRTKPTEADGTYEIIGVKPGDYLVQVARFRNRAEQSSLTVEIPEGVREYRLDIDLPESFVEGLVIDSSGAPVPGVQVQAGLQEDAPIGGLMGIMLQNGLAQAKTDAEGRFKLEGLAKGVYRVSASGKGVSVQQRGILPEVSGAEGAKAPKWGAVRVEDITLDGLRPHTGLVLTLPRAGRITGIVVDGAGQPLSGAGLTATGDDRQRNRQKSRERAITDLFGLQLKPIQSGEDGRFVIDGLTPGTFRVRADADGLAPGVAEGVVVQEGQDTEVRIQVIQGAKLKLRVRNISGENLPMASVSVFDSAGKSLASNVSVMSVFLRYMKNKKKKDSSGWHDIGGIKPDTYTVVVKEKGQPELKIVRTIRDGEEARWDIDLAAELKAHQEGKKD